MIEDIDFSPGTITFNQISELSMAMSLDSQKFYLLNDLLHVNYPNNFLIAIGWYPEEMEVDDGCFIIEVIKDKNWENALYHKEYLSLSELKKGIIQCVNTVKGYI